MYVSDLVNSTLVATVDHTLMQMAAMLKVLSTTLACNCATSAVMKSACCTVINFCDYLRGMVESVRHQSMEDIGPLADFMQSFLRTFKTAIDAMQSLLHTFKTAGENAQVTHGLRATILFTI